MENHNLLSANLRAYQDLRKLTLAEFSTELNIPKTTLRTVLLEGNSNLDTAIRIAKGLGVSLDQLVFSEAFSEKIFILKHLDQAGEWYTSLPVDSRVGIAYHIAEIWRLLGEEQ